MKEKFLLVTPDQYSQGYEVKDGGNKRFTLVKRLPEGTYIVLNPEFVAEVVEKVGHE